MGNSAFDHDDYDQDDLLDRNSRQGIVIKFFYLF